MNAYLFVWNPDKWTSLDRWTSTKLEVHIKEVNKTETYIEDWSCGNTKSIQQLSRFFLIKIGTDKINKGDNVKGIIGSGSIVSEPHMNVSVHDPNKEVLHVNLRFDHLLNPYKENILQLDLLQTGNLAEQHWTPNSSGISIKPHLVDELEALWFDFLATQKISHNPFIQQEDDKQEIFIEGFANQVTLTRYERNPYARKVCLGHYGYSCSVCEFNFQKGYGDIGKDFIHIHHLTQIANIGKEYNIDPIEDLRPVCPNCHAMLHRKKSGLAIEELKSIMLNEKHNHQQLH
jgi:5-methylcytosine-specific restriction protein A